MRTPRISPNVMLTVGAVALAMMAFWGSASYLDRHARDTERRLSGRYESRPVVVAASDLPAGVSIDDAPLASRQVPAPYVSSDAVVADQLGDLSGRRFRVALKRGDPVTLKALDEPGRASLAAELADGLRAVTVPVDEVSSFAGLLEPGDVIDLMYTGDAARAAGGPVMRPLLQAVRVLATGRETRTTRLRDASGNEHEVESPFSTVTVLVTPGDAQKVLLAQKAGSLHVVLRGPSDSAEASLRPVSMADLRNDPQDERAVPGARLEVIVAGPGPVQRTTESIGE